MELGLEKKIGTADRRYNVIRKFIGNQRDRYKKQVNVLPRQTIDNMPEYEMLEPEYEEPILDENLL